MEQEKLNNLYKNEEEFAGSLDGVGELDYILSSPNIVIPVNHNKKKYFYNQSRKINNNSHSRACVIYANLASLGDLFGYEFSDEEIDEVVKIAKKDYGLKDNVGMYVNNGVDCVRRWWNKKYPEKAVWSYRTTIGSPIYEELLRKGHTIVISYDTNKQFTLDSQDDGIVNASITGDTSKNTGHCIRTNIKDTPAKINHSSPSRQNDDNYINVLPFNSYVCDVRNMSNFRANCYYYLTQSAMNKQIYDALEFPNAKLLFLLGKTRGTDPKQPIQREEVMAIVGQLYRDIAEDKIDKEKIKQLIIDNNL